MSRPVYFLPWVRRGLASALQDRDDGGALPASGEARSWVRVNNQVASQTLQIYGPGQVVGIDARAIVRREPQPRTADFEPNYFPFVEVAPADLPWAYTPARAGTKQRLRPWFVLIVVRQQEGVQFTTRSDDALPVLVIESPANPVQELPDLAESWAWAHVQSAVAEDEITETLDLPSTAVVARLMCPRRLTAGQRWRACLVPAFLQGVEAASGDTVSDAAGELLPAWDIRDAGLDGGRIEIPVYDSWTFSTAERGDFEELCRRIEAHNDDGARAVGLHPLDVTEPGLVEPANSRTIVDFAGALTEPNAEPTELGSDQAEAFASELTAFLDDAARRRSVSIPAGAEYNPELHDPLVVPPLYGRWQATASSVPDAGWVNELNLQPSSRAVAGLGAATVRKLQHELMAAAWEASGELRRVNRELSRRRLGLEVNRASASKIRAMEDGEALQLTERLHAFVVAKDGRTLDRALRDELPSGLMSPAFSRMVRPGSAIQKLWTSVRPVASVSKTCTDTFLAATVPSPTAQAAIAGAFADVIAPRGAWTFDAALEMDVTGTGLAASDTSSAPVRAAFDRGDLTTAIKRTSFVPARASIRRSDVSRGTRRTTPAPTRRRRRAPQPALSFRVVRAKPPEVVRQAGRRPGGRDASDAPDRLKASLDPLKVVRAAVLKRMPAVAGAAGWRDDEVPSSVRVGPVFSRALADDLVSIDSELLVPGIGAFPLNRVTALAENPEFVASFLVGANHEMSREFLWREYPADLGATFFHRFWGGSSDAHRDIPDIHAWAQAGALGSDVNLPAGGPRVVVVVRADLIRRYPNVHVYLIPAVSDGGGWSPKGRRVEATFTGMLGVETAYWGFPLGLDQVRGNRAGGKGGHYVVFEEHPGEPRFGLNEPARRDFRRPPHRWSSLSWGHLVESAEKLEDTTHASAQALPRATRQTIDGVTWGRNASHMARITFQQPFRMLIHADRLL